MNDLLLPAIQKSAQDLDPYYNLVSLHLKGDVNTGRNYNAFSDASSNNFRLTNNGDVRSSSFSPYGTSWSGTFNGSSDYLSVANNVPLQLGTDNFTIEFWWNGSPTGTFLQNIGTLISGTESGTYRVGTRINSVNAVYFARGNGTGFDSVSFDVNVNDGAWHHIAIVRSSGVIVCYTDGISRTVLSGSANISGTCTSSNELRLGYNQRDNVYITGYMSNARIVKGVAVYTGTFTPPTSPLAATQSAGTNISAITGTQTSLLTCHANRFIDRDGAAGTLTVTKNGDTRISSFSPFLETDTTTGSGYFDGSTAYLTQQYSSILDLGNSAFTIEAWVYPTVNQTDNWIFGLCTSGGTGYYVFRLTTTNKLQFIWNNFVSNITSTGTLSLNTWSHVAVSCNGSAVTLYINGFADGSGSISGITAAAAGTQSSIGGQIGFARYWNGYISNARLVKGVAVYTGNFTPPTAPLTATQSAGTNIQAITGTQTALLTLQERGAYNTIGFQDESEYQHVITRPSGANVAQGTFSPFSNSGWSVYLDGSATFTAPAGLVSAFAGWGGRTRTWECWVYRTSATTYNLASAYAAVAANGRWYILIGSNNKLSFGWTTGTGSQTSVESTSTVPVGWAHLAVTVDSTNSSSTIIYLGINGIVETFTNNNLSTQTSSYGWNAMFGTAQYLPAGLTGNFTGLRWSNNLRYTANYTLPTEVFVNDSNTLFLLGQQNRFKEQSSNNYTVSFGGTPRVTPFSPFAPVAYDPQVHGGSGYFDGSGDYLRTTGSALAVGSGTFTYEAWIFPTSLAASISGIFDSRIYTGSAGTNGIGLFLTSGGEVRIDNSAGAILTTSGAAITVNSWVHIAAEKSGGNLIIYVNGVSKGSVANSATYSSTEISIGTSFSNAWPFTGYISSFRLVTSAVYGGNFTPPSGPLPFLGNTSLLMNFTNGGVIDSTGKNIIETVGNAGVVTTAIKKYGTGSMYFDGTGDSLTIGPNQLLNIGSSDFTIEFWVYPTGGSLGYPLYSTTSRAKSDVLAFELTTSGSIGVYITQQGGGAWSIASGTIGTLTLNAWSHVALVRSGTSIKGYINGVLGGVNVTSSAAIAAFDGWNVGTNGAGSGYFPGNLDDVRITRGYARYTANFTPPTKALPDRGTLSTLTTDLAAPSSVEALVVAGGASGAKSGNGGSPGGGAGGYIEHPSFAVSNGTSYNITIGAGGAGSAPAAGTFSSNDGNQTLFGSLTAIGGGGSNKQSGNTFIASGRNGGSGGGTGNISSGSGAAGSGTQPSQPGASGTYGFGNSGAQPTGGGDLGGGGGGAGGAAPGVNSGNGGAGKSSSITGISRFYAAGGGSGAYGSGAVAGAGGSAIGGDGVANGSASAASGGSGSKNGAANTGSGGGGSWSDVGGNGSGGSGVVILAYPTSFRPLKASLGLVYTIDTVTRPGYRVYKFTAGTGTVSW